MGFFISLIMFKGASAFNGDVSSWNVTMFQVSHECSKMRHRLTSRQALTVFLASESGEDEEEKGFLYFMLHYGNLL